VLYVLVGMSELTAVGKYVHYWWPDVPTWTTAAVFFVLINLINLTRVSWFGEAEFWFAIVKVVAIIGMIVFGGYLLFSDAGGSQASITNLWTHGGFMPNGWHGLLMALALIMFSFGGLELVGITAAEAAEPRKVIPRAINQLVYRILIFYIGALVVLLSLRPWDQLLLSLSKGGDDYASSPFVSVFSIIGDHLAANILNFVVLTAALSVYNSCVYCNSRMLYGLAVQGDAPKRFLTVNRRGVPTLAIGVSALMTFLCVVVNYTIPERALELLMSLVVAALVINWAMISFAHLKFRAAKDRQGVTPHFKALFYPWANYLCLAFVVLILWIMTQIQGVAISVYVIPFWVGLMWVCYRVKNKQ
jgi:aromatic amino acid transport protein AroP